MFNICFAFFPISVCAFCSYWSPLLTYKCMPNYFNARKKYL